MTATAQGHVLNTLYLAKQAAERRGDHGSVQRITEAITRKENDMRAMGEIPPSPPEPMWPKVGQPAPPSPAPGPAVTPESPRTPEGGGSAVAPPPGPVPALPRSAPRAHRIAHEKNAGVAVAAGMLVRTVQSSSVISTSLHLAKGPRSTACKPEGIADQSALIIEVGADGYDCRRCLSRERVDHEEPPHRERPQHPVTPPPPPAPTVSDRQPISPLPATYEGPYDPLPEAEDPPVGRSLEDAQIPPTKAATIGELVALLLAGRCNPDAPLRTLGRIRKGSPLGVMLSADGSLVIMEVA